MWGAATFELSLGLGVLVMTRGDVCESWGCGLLALIVAGAGVGLGIIVGAVAAVTDARPDIAFILHHTMWGALCYRFGATAAITASVFGLGLGTYSFARRDKLLRETRIGGATHFLTWGVMAIGVGALAVSSAAGAAIGTGALIYPIATLVAYAAGIAWAEVQIADGEAAIATPLISWAEPW